MRTAAALFAATLALATGAAAAPAAWIVERPASSLRFVSSFGGAAFSGGFGRWSADIRFDPADLAHSSVTAAVDTASVATGDADRDQALPTPLFLDAARFPRAVFAAHAFRALGAGRYLAVGTLTLKGVTRPLALPFALAVQGDRARMNASLDLDRLAFGVGQAPWDKTDVLPAAVRVVIAISARRS